MMSIEREGAKLVNGPVGVDGQLKSAGFLAYIFVDLLEPETGGEHRNGLVGRREVDDATSEDLASDG